MFTLTEPSNSVAARFINSQAALPFSYPEVGATRFDPDRSAAPRGYKLDHNRIELGRGAEVFQRGVEALNQWRQFDLGWVTVVPRGVKLEKGATVAVKA